jgi:hypothetical protein
MLYNFFTEGMPDYSTDSFDKPNEYSADIEESPEMHLAVSLKDTLICFACEHKIIERSPKTIAC